jgi:hypothetical protein
MTDMLILVLLVYDDDDDDNTMIGPGGGWLAAVTTIGDTLSLTGGVEWYLGALRAVDTLHLGSPPNQYTGLFVVAGATVNHLELVGMSGTTISGLSGVTVGTLQSFSITDAPSATSISLGPAGQLPFDTHMNKVTINNCPQLAVLPLFQSTWSIDTFQIIGTSTTSLATYFPNIMAIGSFEVTGNIYLTTVNLPLLQNVTAKFRISNAVATLTLPALQIAPKIDLKGSSITTLSLAALQYLSWNDETVAPDIVHTEGTIRSLNLSSLISAKYLRFSQAAGFYDNFGSTISLGTNGGPDLFVYEYRLDGMGYSSISAPTLAVCRDLFYRYSLDIPPLVSYPKLRSTPVLFLGVSAALSRLPATPHCAIAVVLSL